MYNPGNFFFQFSMNSFTLYWNALFLDIYQRQSYDMAINEVISCVACCVPKSPFWQQKGQVNNRQCVHIEVRLFFYTRERMLIARP